MSTVEYWNHVEEIFAAAVAAEDSARTAVLDARCESRAELRAEVEALLAAHARAGGFITLPTVGSPTGSLSGDTVIGTRVGPYQLRERVARGGMGEVFRAERVEGEFVQHVAIKLIAARLRGADTLRRFRAERQILATLQHPHIVTLLDGGVTADGQPFIAMEFIDGLPLTEFCHRHASSLEERLRLFEQLCAAVGFAHRHLVIHRDLKPGNVFVTSEGVVKVLDFGVAKLIDPDQASPGQTMLHGGPMTPNYASPEQVRGLPVTTASDVYALGVMLYELVAGKRPYETAAKTFDEIVTIVVVREPTRPSAAALADLPYDARRLRGDLDAIVRKAMAKDPALRYGSAEELADEVRRVLAGQPVVAHEPSLVYLTRKAIGRHRSAFGVAGVGLVLLIAALLGAIWQARVAARERLRAEQRFADVRALANSLVFELHDAIQALPGATAARRLLVTRALAYVDRLAADNPRDLALRRELAGAYYRLAEVQGNPLRANLGDGDGALASYKKSRQLREDIVAETGDTADRQLVADVDFGIGTLLRARGDMAGARREFTRVVDRLEPLLKLPASAEDPRRRLVPAYQRLAEIANSSDDPEEAARIVATAIGHAEALVRENPHDAQTRLNLSQVLREEADSFSNRGKYPEALQRMRESRAMLEALMSEHPLDTRFSSGLSFALYGEGDLLDRMGDLRGATAVFQHQLDVARSHATDPNDMAAQIAVAVALRQLGDVIARDGRTVQALAHLAEGRAIMAAVVARDPSNGWAIDGLATVVRLHGEALRGSANASHRTQACQAFVEARRHWDALKLRNAFPPYRAEPYQATLSRLAECENRGSAR